MWWETNPQSGQVASLPRKLFLLTVWRKEDEDKGWVLDMQNLCPLPLKAIGSDKVISHQTAPLICLLKSMNIPICTDSFSGKKDYMSRKRAGVSLQCILQYYTVYLQYFIMKVFKQRKVERIIQRTHIYPLRFYNECFAIIILLPISSAFYQSI